MSWRRWFGDAARTAALALCLAITIASGYALFVWHEVDLLPMFLIGVTGIAVFIVEEIYHA